VPLRGNLGLAGCVNVQGENTMKLGQIANAVVSFICRQAGGGAVDITGQPVLSIKPGHHHQRTALYLDSKELVTEMAEVLEKQS
jgi:hypothetical protein